VDIAIKIQDGFIQDVAVNSIGCAISVAAGSMLAELLPGKSLAEAEELGKAFEGLLKGEIKELPEDIGDLESLEGVSRFPVRVKCAMLAWKTIQRAVGLLKEGTPSKERISTEDATTEASRSEAGAAKHNGANRVC
jgi:nitrogen fixation NifU-like protein